MQHHFAYLSISCIDQPTLAKASREQDSGIERVNRAILSMDQVTQQNAALVEETAAASQSMGEQARERQSLMGFFKWDEQGLSEAATTGAAKPSQSVGKAKPIAALASKPAVATKPKPTPVEKKPPASHAVSEEWEEFYNEPKLTPVPPASTSALRRLLPPASPQN